MRQTISGLIVAAAVVTASAAPALACGFGWCSPCAVGYAAPCATLQVYDRLPDPDQQYHSPNRVHQYYYVNQGPTFTGPGAFAPYPTYEESAVLAWGAYRYRPYRHGQPTLRRYY